MLQAGTGTTNSRPPVHCIRQASTGQWATHIQQASQQLPRAAKGDRIESNRGHHCLPRPCGVDEHEHGGGHAEADEAEGSCEQSGAEIERAFSNMRVRDGIL